MNLGKVLGTVVATQKDCSLEGMKLYVIQSLDENQREVGKPLVAVDIVSSNIGDLIYWVEKREASVALPEPFAPVDATIVGIVDQVNIG